VAAPAVFEGGAEVETDGLGVADVQIAVGFGWKAGDDLRMFTGSQIRINDVMDEIAAWSTHDFSLKQGAFLPDFATNGNHLCGISGQGVRFLKLTHNALINKTYKSDNNLLF
jgi:hypothetical protein